MTTPKNTSTQTASKTTKAASAVAAQPETKRPALGRSTASVRSGLRAGAGKADLVNCI